MALVLNNLVDLLHVHADLKIDRIHLNARDEFLLSRAFSLGHRRNFWISALLIQSPNLAVRRVSQWPDRSSRCAIAGPTTRPVIAWTSLRYHNKRRPGLNKLGNSDHHHGCANHRNEYAPYNSDVVEMPTAEQAIDRKPHESSSKCASDLS